uniref:Uncharacterized protein n=1 Tax=Phytophthora ramorum TaxID=164328 RepID=H3H3F3_PHYRM
MPIRSASQSHISRITLKLLPLRPKVSLIDLAPANTKRARENASRIFLKSLADEEVAWDYLETCMKRDNAAQVLKAVVDKFGFYLAFKEGRKGQLLARHSVMQYVRQAKNWLLEQFPHHRALVDKNLLKKGQMLERHCMKRETGAFAKKAPACTKTALKKMMEYLYSTAVTAADYEDAVLVALMWFLFGRASDLTMLRKANLSVGSGKSFFVHFIRIKTLEEQGLSLFPDGDFATCPLLAIAVALATQTAPTISVLSQLPEQTNVSQTSLSPSTPLIDLLDHPQVVTPPQDSAGEAGDGTSTDTAPGMHSYVNRVLDRIAEKAGAVEHLTSHSFCGGAGSRKSMTRSVLASDRPRLPTIGGGTPLIRCDQKTL